MAIQRIEWQCPGCRRKFAIPSQQPRPQLCPDCQRTAQQKQQPAAPAEPDVSFSDYPTEAGPAASPALAARPVKRRRYEVLRTISLWFKVLSFLLGAVLLMALAGIGKMVLDAPPGPDRLVFVFSWLVTVVAGVTLVLAVYAFAVLLLTAIDIEYNTRQD